VGLRGGACQSGCGGEAHANKDLWEHLHSAQQFRLRQTR
jgi:hypothetical protein